MCKEETLESVVAASDIIINAANMLANSAPEAVDVFEFHKLASKSVEENVEPKQALHLIAQLCSFHFVPRNKADPFQPMARFGDRRSMIPADLSPAQVEELAAAVSQINNPGLRARIADVAWNIKRSDASLGFAAVAAYARAVEAVESGSAKFSFDNASPVGVQALEYLERMCVMMRMLGWDKAEFEAPKSLISRLLARYSDGNDVQGFIRIAILALEKRLGDAQEIAKCARRMADDVVEQNDHDLKIWVLALAADAFHTAGDADKKNEALILRAECTVQKSRYIKSYIIRAEFLKEAIEDLTKLPNTMERRRELEEELRIVQPHIKDEIPCFRRSVDISDIVKASLDVVRGETFPQALFQLFNCDRVPDPETLQKDVKEQMARTPLSSLFAPTVYARDGRVVFQGGDSDLGNPSSEHLKFKMARRRECGRHIVVQGAINPLRLLLQDSFPFKEHMLFDLIKESPFVPEGQEAIFSRGADAFLHGDDMLAAHLLAPQLENSLRHILALEGVDTVRTRQNGLQEVATLSTLLTRYRDKLERILGADLVHEIDLLFDFSGGPRLRNDLAHGQMHGDEFYSHNTIYGCWLILHIMFRPLFGEWSNFEQSFALQTGLYVKHADETQRSA